MRSSSTPRPAPFSIFHDPRPEQRQQAHRRLDRRQRDLPARRQELTVGGNNLSTIVTGVLADGGSGAHRSLADQDRHRHADAVGHQHLYRRDHCRRRHAGSERLDHSRLQRRHRERGRHARRQRHRRQYPDQRRHAVARQFDRAFDGAGQSRLHGGGKLHGRALAERRRPRQRHRCGDAWRSHRQAPASRPPLHRQEIYHSQCRRRRQRHVRLLSSSTICRRISAPA